LPLSGRYGQPLSPRWRRQAPLKLRQTSTGLLDPTTQKTAISFLPYCSFFRTCYELSVCPSIPSTILKCNTLQTDIKVTRYEYYTKQNNVLVVFKCIVHKAVVGTRQVQATGAPLYTQAEVWRQVPTPYATTFNLTVLYECIPTTMLMCIILQYDVVN
jgi:hypothetical protein